MVDQRDIWLQQDQEAFKHLTKNWSRRFNGDARREVIKNTLGNLGKLDWEQDRLGYYHSPLEGVSVFNEDGEPLPLEICLPNDAWMLRDSDLTRILLEYAFGERNNTSLIGAGTRSWGGLVNWHGIDIAMVYMNEVDITGPDKLVHCDLLHKTLESKLSGLRVPKPILATTNCYFSMYVENNPQQKLADTNIYEEELNKIRDDLIYTSTWDKRFNIDSSPANFRVSKKGRVYNIDPVFWHGKFIF